MIIGIDFGTCYSSAAIMSGNIPVTNFVKDTTGMGVPSLFMYSESEGREIYGEGCLTGAAQRRSSDVVRYMKRTVREDPANLDRTIVSGGQSYTIREVIKKYLTYLIGEVKSAAVKSGEFRNTDFEVLTITAPVGAAAGQMMASEYNRLLQDTVCEITGLPEDRVKILHEPVAAAISYLYSESINAHYDGTQKILVFDLGGGTLDVTIVNYDPSGKGEYEFLAKEGNLQLGGNEWDAALGQAVLDKLGMTWSGTDEERVRFDMNVTKLKMDLSVMDETNIFVSMNGEDTFTRFTRAEFEECTKDLLERAMDVVRRALDFDSGSAPDKYVLVGGSSNMPQILRGFKEILGIGADLISVFEPSKAIAKGAAIFAKMNSSTDGSAIGPKVLDMATLTYGFRCEHEGRLCIFNMIYKGSRFDDYGRIVKRSVDDFVPVSDDQTSVKFVIYESECRKGEGIVGDVFAMDNGEIANGLEVSVQVPAEYLGRARAFRMWVTMTLDENSILDIVVTDRTGKELAYATSFKR